VCRLSSRTNARRGLRERQRLVKERTAHGNRIKGLLKTQGIMDFDSRAADAAAHLDAIVTGDGRPLAACLKREIVRELDRLALVMRQIDQVETERDAVVQACDAGVGTDALAAEPERGAAMIGELNQSFSLPLSSMNCMQPMPATSSTSKMLPRRTGSLAVAGSGGGMWSGWASMR